MYIHIHRTKASKNILRHRLNYWEPLKRMVNKQENWYKYDVRSALKKDPHAGGVSPNENGSFPVTIKAVFRQPGFADMIIKMLEWGVRTFMWCGPGGLLLYCTKGCHRSCVSIRAWAQGMNQLTTPDGQRMFNVQLFPLTTAYGRKGQISMIHDAMRWPHHPWNVTVGGLAVPSVYQYGYLETQSDEMAHNNFKAIDMYLRNELQAFTNDVFGEYHGEDHELFQVPPIAPRPSSAPGADSIEPDESVREYALALDQTKGGSSKRADFARLDLDVDAWWELLDEYKIDKTARMNLFLLAQMGIRGQYETLEILTKLQHKGFKGELDDPSKWLHKCASGARQRLSKSLGLWVEHAEELDCNVYMTDSQPTSSHQASHTPRVIPAKKRRL